MRHTLTLVLALLVGCVPPVAAEVDEAGLTLRPIETGEGWALELLNDSGADFVVGCSDGYCGEGEVPTLRYEALQVDGTWLERDWSGARFSDLNQPTTVPAGGAWFLGVRREDELAPGPGTYRAIVSGVDPSGARREAALTFARVGWDDGHLAEAEAIEARARAHACYPLASSVAPTLQRTLEPDALVAWGEGRAVLLDEMLERGGFVPEITQRLAVADLDTVRRVGDWLRPRAEGVQRPLRGAVVTRLADGLEGPAPIEADDTRTLTALADAWSEDLPARIVARLERGPEEGDALAVVLDMTTHVDRVRFEGLAPRLLAVLDTRCGGASGDLAESCERVRLAYDPDTLMGFGIGFSSGWSGGCGGVGRFSPTPACVAVEADWDALVVRAGDVETVWLRPISLGVGGA